MNGPRATVRITIKFIDLMFAHVSKEKIEGAYHRAAYMPLRRELAHI